LVAEFQVLGADEEGKVPESSEVAVAGCGEPTDDRAPEGREPPGGDELVHDEEFAGPGGCDVLAHQRLGLETGLVEGPWVVMDHVGRARLPEAG